MRRIQCALLAAVAVVGFASVASAADMPVKAPLSPAPVVGYNWTGCYVGGNVGGGWAKTAQTRIGRVDGTVLPPEDFGSANGSSFVGGGQIGCDYQFTGSWVVGVQGMFDFGNIDSNHIIPPFPTFSSADRTKNIYTATARIGYLAIPQLLAYIKGGAAWTQTDSTITIPSLNFLSEFASGVSRSGWTLGGGLEWMFAHGWSMFVEYNYMDFGNRNISYIVGPTAVPPSDVIATRLTAQTALIGLNYKFNFGGLVVAEH